MSEKKRAALLVEFDRLEALARAAIDAGASGTWTVGKQFDSVITTAPQPNPDLRRHYGGPVVGESMERAYRDHIIANDPARTLRRLAAVRKVAARHVCGEPTDGWFYCKGCDMMLDVNDGGCLTLAELHDAYCGPT